MIYKGVTKALVPWYDTDGMKQRSLLTFRGDIDKRALLKTIVGFVKLNFKKTVSTTWVKKNVPIINDFVRDGKQSLTLVNDPRVFGRQFEDVVEAWIKRLEEAEEDDATEAGTDSTGEIPDATQAEEQVCSVPTSD